MNWKIWAGLGLALVAVLGIWQFTKSLSSEEKANVETTTTLTNPALTNPALTNPAVTNPATPNSATTAPVPNTYDHAGGNPIAQPQQTQDQPQQNADLGSWGGASGSNGRATPQAYTPTEHWGLQMFRTSDLEAGANACQKAGLLPGQLAFLNTGSDYIVVFLHKGTSQPTAKAAASAANYPAVKKAQGYAGARKGSGFAVQVPDGFLQWDGTSQSFVQKRWSD